MVTVNVLRFLLILGSRSPMWLQSCWPTCVSAVWRPIFGMVDMCCYQGAARGHLIQQETPTQLANLVHICNSLVSNGSCKNDTEYVDWPFILHIVARSGTLSQDLRLKPVCLWRCLLQFIAEENKCTQSYLDWLQGDVEDISPKKWCDLHWSSAETQSNTYKSGCQGQSLHPLLWPHA